MKLAPVVSAAPPAEVPATQAEPSAPRSEPPVRSIAELEAEQRAYVSELMDEPGSLEDLPEDIREEAAQLIEEEK